LEVQAAVNDGICSTGVPPQRPPEKRVVPRRQAESLAAALFSMQEPWRSRFLSLVANLATRWKWEAREPTPEEITVWLGANPVLYQQVKSLLYTWQG
jgi:hypothetical protein